jgi:multiple sugar transport system ATP-binding protein
MGGGPLCFSMANVILKNVRKVFPGDVEAVKDFSLDIETGEFIVLVGPSGCGKSTTLRMIAGLEEISSGKISIGDRVVNDLPPKDRDIAMVFQNYALYPHMSVFDNMAFSLKMRKMPKADIQKRVNEAAEMLDIEELLKRRPKELSGGQRQRVAVGRAIVRQPAAFLFDEPLSNLDAKLRVQMRVEISRLHHNLDTTMIYVTHDQVEAMTMGDRIVVMKDGIIEQVAPPEELYDNPATKFVASFIGTPPMNFIDGKITGENGTLNFDEGTFSLPLPEMFMSELEPYRNKRITFGIRPEDIGSERAALEKDAVQIRFTVDVVEPMGSETILYVRTDNNSFISRVDPHKTCKAGDCVELAVNLPKAHFFDADTDKLIA